MNIRPPIAEAASPTLDKWSAWSQGWSNFFTQLFEAVGWLKSWSYKFTLDFPSVPANSQSAGITVSADNFAVVPGDSVCVTPMTDVVGLIFKGVVTSSGTVTIYACNFTTGAINPPSMQYRVVVIQN